MKTFIKIIMFLILAIPIHAFCKDVCIESIGEAPIIDNDVYAAKMEAIARAKWTAIEKALGLEIKGETVVQNNAFIDEAVIKKIKRMITDSKTIYEQNKQSVYLVKLNVCVEPSKAKETVLSLALNKRISIFILTKRHRQMGMYDETNILSEKLTGRLVEHGYSVVDIAGTRAIERERIENAIQGNDYFALRTIMYKFFSNVLIIGKTDYSIGTKRGEDIGYGIAMPFQHVIVRLIYRIVTRDSSGNIFVLAAGSEQGKGLANHVSEAIAQGMEDLAEKFLPKLAEKLNEFIQGITKRVLVKVVNVADMGYCQDNCVNFL